MTFNQEIRATAELCGTQLSEFAAELLAEELARFPENLIRGALNKCRRELKGRLNIAEILSRIDDGRPSADEAFSKLPWDEEQTAVWTDEMREAMGQARASWNFGDKQGARLVFREVYNRLVADNRSAGIKVNWTSTYGIRNRPFDSAEERDSYCESKHEIRAQADREAQVLNRGGEYPLIEKPKDSERTQIPEEVKQMVRKALKGMPDA